MPDPAAGVLSESQWFLNLSPMIDALRLQPADFNIAMVGCAMCPVAIAFLSIGMEAWP